MASMREQSSLTPSDFGKVAVLMGGWSSEREVSLHSGKAVLHALQQRGIDAHAIDVNRDTIMQVLLERRFDRVFIMLHGKGGEDGVIQAVLEVLGIPYTGSGVLASALAMDKLRTKQLLEGAGLPTPKYMVLDDGSNYDYVAAALGLPIMIKPALEGSSIGMSKVDSIEQFATAYQEAAKYSGAILAEQWIQGNEYTIAILGETALPIIRLQTKRAFYDYTAKYLADDTQYHCPCGLSAEDEARMQRLALAVFRAIDAKGWGRVDILTDQTERPYIIEINTVPGMTDHSLVPMAARAQGMTFDELVWRILALTLTDNHPATASRRMHNVHA